MWDLKRKDSGTRGHGDSGTQGHGTQRHWDMGLVDAGTLRHSRMWGTGTRGHDKQTTPGLCSEFVIYNFPWSRGRYYVLERLSADQ